MILTCLSMRGRWGNNAGSFSFRYLFTSLMDHFTGWRDNRFCSSQLLGGSVGGCCWRGEGVFLSSSSLSWAACFRAAPTLFTGSGFSASGSWGFGDSPLSAGILFVAGFSCGESGWGGSNSGVVVSGGSNLGESIVLVPLDDDMEEIEERDFLTGWWWLVLVEVVLGGKEGEEDRGRFVVVDDTSVMQRKYG